MDVIRVGVVGAGWIATEHRRVLESLADAELVAVCDTDLDRAGALAAGTGARTYADWRDLLDGAELGALFVCTPPQAHREPAVAALRQGLPVYLEKPVARTPGDAAEIVAAAAASGTVCAVGYQWHALDLLGELPGLLDGQQIGLLTGTSIGPTESRPWFTDMRAGGGNLLERGSHHLDLIRAVAGEVTSVQAAASRVRLARGADEAGDIDDALTIMLELASGALATVVIAWTRAGLPGSYGLDIIASEATLRLALDPDFALSGVSRGEPVDLRAAGPPFGRSVRRFLDAVRDRDPAAVACTPADAAATLAVAVAAEEALATARSVPVEAVLPVPRTSGEYGLLIHLRYRARRGPSPGKDRGAPHRRSGFVCSYGRHSTRNCRQSACLARSPRAACCHQYSTGGIGCHGGNLSHDSLGRTGRNRAQ